MPPAEGVVFHPVCRVTSGSLGRLRRLPPPHLSCPIRLLEVADLHPGCRVLSGSRGRLRRLPPPQLSCPLWRPGPTEVGYYCDYLNNYRDCLETQNCNLDQYLMCKPGQDLTAITHRQPGPIHPVPKQLHIDKRRQQQWVGVFLLYIIHLIISLIRYI
jgi:hypothetical protein